eukprot:SAG31_NODE_430_length_15792_cov_15.908558_20_plen_50_part_00
MSERGRCNSKEDFTDRREDHLKPTAGGDDQQVEAPSGVDSSNTLSSIKN